MHFNALKTVRMWAVSAALLIPWSSAHAQGASPAFQLDYDVWLVSDDKLAGELQALSGSPDEIASGAKRLLKAAGEHVTGGRSPMVAGQPTDWTTPLPTRNPADHAGNGQTGLHDPSGRVVMRAKCDNAPGGGIAISLGGRIGAFSAGAKQGVPPTRSTSVFELSSIASSGVERVHSFDPGGGQPRLVVFVAATSLSSSPAARSAGEREQPADLRCELWRVDNGELAREVDDGSDRALPKDLIQRLRQPGNATMLIGLRSLFLPGYSASVGFSDEQPAGFDPAAPPKPGEMRGYTKRITTLAVAIRSGNDGVWEADIRKRIAESPVAPAANQPAELTPVTLRVNRSGLASCRIDKDGDPHTYIVVLTSGDGG